MLKGNFPVETDAQARSRKSFVFISCVFLSFLILTGRLFYLQYVRYEENYQNSENNRQRKVILKAERGSIFDRHGKILVRNRPSYQVVISARELKDKDSVFTRLLNIRDSQGNQVFDSATVDTAFQRSRWIRNRPLRILEDASPEQVALIEERSMDLPGVMTLVESRREYPYETTAAHVFGYTGELSEEELKKEEYRNYSPGDRIGKKGLELKYEEDFRGEDGVKYVEVNAYGREVGLIQGVEIKEAVPGHHLITTLDFDLQEVAEKVFPDSVRGAVVALDPRNGEILAMVSSPRLDPNIFSLRRRERNKGWAQVALDTTHPLTNRAISGVYPPASVFKLVTAGSGLENDFIHPKTYMSKPCKGGYQFGSRYQKCWSVHGNLDVVNALRVSCDTYFYQLGLQIGMKPINEFGERFGLGSLLGIDIPGERGGWLPDSVSFNERYKKSGWLWTRGLILNLSIGQGQLVTPLQQAALVGAIATGKGVYQPHLMKEIRDVNHELVTRFIPKKIYKGEMKPETHQMLLDALDSVVNHSGGTGKRAALPGIRVGGKSGSGEWKKGEKTHAWFVSVAPLEDPQIVVAVIMEAAGGGGAKSAPICKKVMEAYFQKYPVKKEVLP